MKSAVATLVLTFVMGVAACSKDAASHDAGQPTAADARHEAEGRAEDRAALEGIVALDVRASNAMRDADGAATRGDAGAASEAVSKRAMPAVDEALRAVEAARMKTAWGAARREALLAVLRERKAEMPRYREAATSGDPDKLLAAVQAQAAIERRALGAVAALQDER